MAVNPIPEDRACLSPYLVVKGADAIIEFLKQTFNGVETLRSVLPSGAVMHAEVKIRDCVVMISDASDEVPPFPAMMNVYVEDVDDTYTRALRAGATSLREPRDEVYGDRSAGVKDVAGNVWWIAAHVRDLTPEEWEKVLNPKN